MKNGCNSWDGEGEELCQSHFKEEEKCLESLTNEGVFLTKT